MATSPQSEKDQFDKLREWLTSLPSQIDYDRAEGVASRQEFLQHICGNVSPEAAIAVYLYDRAEKGSFLTLAYAHGIPKRKPALPRRVELQSKKVGTEKLLSYDDSAFVEFALEHKLYEILPTILSEGPSLVGTSLRESDLGLALVFLPDVSLLTPVVRTQLGIAWRMFSIETARSRYRRKALATSEMLAATATQATKEKLCATFNHYCRSQAVLLYERLGSGYFLVATTQSNQDKQKRQTPTIKRSDVPRLIHSRQSLRSHVLSETPSKQIQSIVGKLAWMLVPCFTDALDVLTAKKDRHPQYLLLLIGKENAEYLGDDFSLTDLSIAQTLVSLLSSHLPYMDLAETFSKIHSQLDKRSLGKFDLSWFSDLAKGFLPGLWGIGIFPDFPSEDGVTCHPKSFHVLRDTVQEVRWPRPFELCTGLDGADDLNCLVFRTATEYRSEQRIIFAFDDRYVAEPQMQILNILVEHARSEFSVNDFRDFHISTQAQIRHVIRGSLSAAISEIELVESRVGLYSNMPTKLVKLLETPTMRDGMTNTLQWLTEASALVEAPRYLLDSFDSSSVRWSDVKPVSVVRSVLAICRAELRRRGLRVEFKPSDKDEAQQVSVDPEFIKIVIFNIIDNAVKYSFQDHHLRVELRFSETHWRFEVENLGVPIRKEDRKKIFDPFVRSSQYFLANRRPGTGLGLAVSRRILEAHDERAIFDCDSELIGDRPPMARTTFFFELSLKGKREAVE